MKYKLNDQLGIGRHRLDTVRQVIDSDFDYMGWTIDTVRDFELDNDALLYYEDTVIRNIHKLSQSDRWN